jgi:hypothetical protein
MRNVAMAVGLSLMAALGLLAFSAVGAQAQSFSVGGAGNFLLTNATGKQIGSGTLLVPGRNYELECKTGAVNSGHLSSKTHASGQVTFSECVALRLSDLELLPCLLKENIVANFLIAPNGGNMLFSPTGTNFTVIRYQEGTECPLPLNNPVSGNLIAEVPALEAIKPIAVFKKSLQEGTHKATFGGFATVLHAEFEIELTGAHTGLSLGVH